MKHPSTINKSNSLLAQFKFDNLDSAEEELRVQYGERYTEYRRQFQLAGEMEYEPDFPLYIMLEQTYRCNLRCVSCIHGYPDLKRQYDLGVSNLPWDIFERIILEGEEHNCPSISMHTNDEPLLIKDLSKRIAFARKHGFMDVIMTTNGILFTEDKIKEVIDAGVTRILFSIDALTEQTYMKVRPGGDLKKVHWAIKGIKEYRENIKSHLPILRASFVPNILNQHEIKPFLKFYSELVDYVDIQPFSAYYDTNSKLVPKGSKRITHFHCNQPWRYLIVRGNGDVLPCCSFYGSEIVVGNIAKSSLYDIFNSDYMRQLRDEFKNGIYRHKACNVCSQSSYTLDINHLPDSN